MVFTWWYLNPSLSFVALRAVCGGVLYAVWGRVKGRSEMRFGFGTFESKLKGMVVGEAGIRMLQRPQLTYSFILLVSAGRTIGSLLQEIMYIHRSRL